MQDVLRSADVQFLVDVRSFPRSRFQPEFGQERLKSLVQLPLRYVFMGDQLGGRPNDLDCYTDGHVDYTKLATQARFLSGIARILNAHRQGLNICLMCSEAQPSQCHRSKLIGEVLAREGVSMEHLLPSGETATQRAVMQKLLEQPDLFGTVAATRSRKAYR